MFVFQLDCVDVELTCATKEHSPKEVSTQRTNTLSQFDNLHSPFENLQPTKSFQSIGTDTFGRYFMLLDHFFLCFSNTFHGCLFFRSCFSTPCSFTCLHALEQCLLCETQCTDHLLKCPSHGLHLLFQILLRTLIGASPFAPPPPASSFPLVQANAASPPTASPPSYLPRPCHVAPLPLASASRFPLLHTAAPAPLAVQFSHLPCVFSHGRSSASPEPG